MDRTNSSLGIFFNTEAKFSSAFFDADNFCAWAAEIMLVRTASLTFIGGSFNILRASSGTLLRLQHPYYNSCITNL